MGDKKQICVPREDAVFWMDQNGIWHNEHGKFEHPKVIRYFNASIRKDDHGYYVYQSTDEFDEKVYFPYVETAVFAVDVRIGETVELVLNIHQTISIHGGDLLIRSDNLYLKTPEHLIKFTPKAMLKLARFITEQDDGHMVLTVNGQTCDILTADP